MQFDCKNEQIIKTIRFDKDLVVKIEKMAKDCERDFSSQIRFILKEYIELKEKR